MYKTEDVEIEKLKMVIIPCREPVPVEAYQYYNSAYQLWHRVWSETLKELDGVEKLFSNEFTRHDFAIVIFRDDEAISLMCFSSINLKLEVRKNDSWFAAWPEGILLNQEIKDGLGLIAAWFCTAPEYRRSNFQYPVNTAKLVMEAFGKIVLDENYNAGYGTSRNNRGVNKLLYDVGAIKLGESIAHGCSVDLVILEPGNVQLTQLSYSNIFKKLWQNKTDFRVRGYEQKLSKAA